MVQIILVYCQIMSREEKGREKKETGAAVDDLQLKSENNTYLKKLG